MNASAGLATASNGLSAVGSVWSAAAASVTAITAIFAVYFAYHQVAQARKLREDQAQPYVAVFIESERANPQFIDLVVRNYGRTAATNVSLAIDPPPERSPDDHGKDPDEVLYPRKLMTLVPGQEWRTVWDFSPTRRELSLPSRYLAHVSYDGIAGTPRQSFDFELDWGFFVGRRWVTTYTVHDAAKALREMEKQIRRWGESLGGRGIRVYVRDGDAHDRNLQARRDEAMKEHDEITRMLGLNPDKDSDDE